MALLLPYHCHSCGRNWPASEFRDRRKTCMACQREYRRDRYVNDPEVRNRAIEYNRERYATPSVRKHMLNQQRGRRQDIDAGELIREHDRERNRERYANDLEYRDRQREVGHEYRKAPGYRERQREYQRGYREEPDYKDRMRVHIQRYKARKRGLPDTLTTGQWQYALTCFDGCCAVCGRQLNDMFGEFYAAADHWIPLTYEGDDNPGTVAANIVPLCHGIGGCNNHKHSAMPDEWLAREYNTRKAREIAQRIQSYFDSLIGDE